jgi:hypothetical protein
LNSLFDLEDGDSTSVRKVCQLLQDYTASYPKSSTLRGTRHWLGIYAYVRKADKFMIESLNGRDHMEDDRRIILKWKITISSGKN